jgi:hypothetical protein
MFEPLAGTTRCAWLRAGDPHAMNTNEIDSHLVYPGELGFQRRGASQWNAAAHSGMVRNKPCACSFIIGGET